MAGTSNGDWLFRTPCHLAPKRSSRREKGKCGRVLRGRLVRFVKHNYIPKSRITNKLHIHYPYKKYRPLIRTTFPLTYALKYLNYSVVLLLLSQVQRRLAGPIRSLWIRPLLQ
jgi:hypothetical protein